MWQKAHLIGRPDQTPFYVRSERPVVNTIPILNEETKEWDFDNEVSKVPRPFYRTNVLSPKHLIGPRYLYVAQEDVELLSEFLENPDDDKRFTEED